MIVIGFCAFLTGIAHKPNSAESNAFGPMVLIAIPFMWLCGWFGAGVLRGKVDWVKNIFSFLIIYSATAETFYYCGALARGIWYGAYLEEVTRIASSLMLIFSFQRYMNRK